MTFSVGDITKWMMEDYDKTVGKEDAKDSTDDEAAA